MSRSLVLRHGKNTGTVSAEHSMRMSVGDGGPTRGQARREDSEFKLPGALTPAYAGPGPGAVMAVQIQSIILLSVAVLMETWNYDASSLRIKYCKKNSRLILKLRGGRDFGEYYDPDAEQRYADFTNLDGSVEAIVEDAPADDPVTKARYLQKFMNETGLNQGVSRCGAPADIQALHSSTPKAASSLPRIAAQPKPAVARRS